MPSAADAFSVQWGDVGAGIAAIGSLGVAAFGIVESLGKAFAFTLWLGAKPPADAPPGTSKRKLVHWGLPYVGLECVNRMIGPLHPALERAYGEDYAEIIAQQYRSDRSQGAGPDTIRQGVRLGLPFLGEQAAAKLIGAVWRLDTTHALGLARALQAPGADQPPAPAAAASGSVDQMQALAGRFSTALDARISAAFDLADERYETVAKTAAGGLAILMSAVFNYGLVAHANGFDLSGRYPWPIALGAGLVAVPLAPVAKDLSTKLQDALTAFKSISGKSS